MKRYTTILAILVLALNSNAQNDGDALRFSQYFYNGTARSMAMGNAFGALGGDITSLSINPAGLGVYRSSEFIFTPMFYYDKSSSSYEGENRVDYYNRLSLNNLGFVASFITKKDSGWKGINLAVGYNRLADFNRNIVIYANKASSSYLDEFVHFANGVDTSNLDPNYEALAWQPNNNGLLYLKNMNNPKDYTNDLVGIYGESQKRTLSTTGGIGETVISFGTNLNNVLYIGATIGIQNVSYNEQMIHSENNEDTVIKYFQSLKFQQNFSTHGTGYNLKVGAIFKPVEFLRFGLAFHTPTFYSLHSEMSTSMDSYLVPQPSYPDHYYKESPVNVFDYQLVTPFRLIGSAGLQLQDIALVSAEYEYVNYSSMHFHASGEDYSSTNATIQDAYKATSNIRLGAEVKLGPLALRGGYSYYGSPYKSGELNKSASYNILSAGFGIRLSKVFFDMAYSYTMHPEKYSLYTWGTGSAISDLNMNTSRISASFGFRF